MQLDNLKLVDRPRTPRRFGLRFSLLSLLALIFAACFAAAWYGAVVRHRAALRRIGELQLVVAAREAEISAQDRTIELMRSQLGVLTITDPSKIHALEVPTQRERHWRWRVYLPPGKWTLLASTGKIPKQGFENVSFTTSSAPSVAQLYVEAWTEIDEEGKPRLAVRSENGTARHSISALDFEKLKSGCSWSSIGQTQQVRDARQPLELLRLRTHDVVTEHDGSRTTRSSDEPTFGILIWIEPDGERSR